MKCKTLGIGMLLAGLAFTCPSNAQEPTSTEAGSSEVVVMSADDKIQDFLASKGWTEGNNGGKLFVSTGVGISLAKPGEKSYLSARNNAFKKAMLIAKQGMTTYLGESISSSIKQSYSEPEYVEEQQAEVENLKGEEELGMWDKTTLIIHSELDTMLGDRGVDLDTDEGKEAADAEVKRIIVSESFSDTITTVACNEVAGLTAYKIFECQPSGKQGEIGVICVYSEKTREMANALLGKGGIPEKKKAKQPLIDQINKDQLVCTFGVQQRIDENGDIAILAFAHGIPRTNSTRSMSAAKKKAEVAAKGEIRRFAGEMVAMGSVLDSAESYQELEDAAGELSQAYKNTESYEEYSKSTAAALMISGITKLYSKEVTHPLTGESFYVVVMKWSPTDADQANELRGTLAKMSGSKGGSGRTKTTPKKDSEKANSGGSGAGGSDEGQEGDDDAFE